MTYIMYHISGIKKRTDEAERREMLKEGDWFNTPSEAQRANNLNKEKILAEEKEKAKAKKPRKKKAKAEE